jgi:hypothetical protein
MDLQAFVYSYGEGLDLPSIRSTFVDVDANRLLNSLIELGSEGVVEITIRHKAHDTQKAKTSRSSKPATESVDQLSANA